MSISDFGFSNPNPTQDQTIQKPFPGFVLVGTENLGGWNEFREVTGSTWLTVNAAYNSGTGGFQQINVALSSYALVLSSTGAITYYAAAAAAPNPIAWSATGILFASGSYAETVFKTAGAFSFITPANSSAFTIYRFRIVSGGGGGGGANGVFAAAGGGGSGGYAEGSFTGVGPSTSIPITVGAGGTAGSVAGGVGGSGGATVLGAPISVSINGGIGGSGSTASSAGGGGAGGAGGGLTLGSPAVSQNGANGGNGLGILTSTAFISGAGGGSAFGGGGQPATGGAAGTAGFAGTSFGSGGGGGVFTASAGGAGALGIVIIERMTA